MKLVVIKYFTYEEKIKLVDIFPPVVRLITTFNFDLIQTIVMDAPRMAALFEKLTRVKKITLTRRIKDIPGYGCIADAIFSGSNCGIELFDEFHNMGNEQ